MPSTYSPSLKLELIGNGEQTNTWGDTTNNNLGTLIEQAITGVGSITLTGDYTLTNYNGLSDDARNAVLVFSGALANAANVYAPTVEKTYIVVNKSGANVTIKTSIGNGITLTNNTSQLVYCDNTNFYTALNVNSVTGDMTVTGNESVGGTFTVGGRVTFNGNLLSLTNTLSFTSSTGIIDASANTGALVPPTGATSDRPASPSLGTARWNTTLGWYEIWNGSVWVPITGSYAASYLIVAGGGGGGGGSGGGAGGLLANTATVTSGTNYTVIVGSGGTYGLNGSNSSAFTKTAIGGGGGNSQTGHDGGSGGGGQGYAGGLGTAGQGNNGGTGFPGCGGGGAGQAGINGDGTYAGSGGNGSPSTITGTPTYYAGGGGGYGPAAGGYGGAGGGGRGASDSYDGSNGTANTGGGGGGGGNISNNGGTGGTGVVIVSYVSSYQRGSGGNVTTYTFNGSTYYVHTFTTSGTFTA